MGNYDLIRIDKMKTTLLSMLASSAAAFRSSSNRASTAIRSTAALEDEVEAVKVYPTVNGWTADPSAFCAGLPGAVSPLGNFDPLGFTKNLPVQEIKRFREAEVTHGRVAMLASVGYLVAEKFHPLFNGVISGPASSHLGQVQSEAPFFFAFLGAMIAIAEFGRSLYGWETPLEAIRKNRELEKEDGIRGKRWLSKLNDNYYPGDISFDPLGLKPSDPKEFEVMQTKELNNGRLAMIAVIGMMVQEQVTGSTLF